MLRILIADDEEMIVEAVSVLINELNIDQPIEICKAYLAREALDIMRHQRIDLLISDIRMPQVTGVELLRQVRANWPACRTILITAYQEPEYLYDIAKMDNSYLILKSEGFDKLGVLISEVVWDITADQKTVNRMNYLEKNSTHYRKMMRSQLLFQMFTSGSTPSQQQLSSFTFQIADAPCVACCVRVGAQDTSCLYHYEELEFKLDSLCGPEIVRESTMDYKGHIGYLFQDQTGRPIEQLVQKLKQLFEFIVDSSGTTYGFCFTVAGGLQNLEHVYRFLLVEQGRINGGGFVVQRLLSRQLQARYFELYSAAQETELLAHTLEWEQYDHFRELLARIANLLKLQPERDAPAVELYMSTALQLSYILSGNQIWNEIGRSLPVVDLMNPNAFQSWNEAGAYLIRLGDAIIGCIGKNIDERSHDQIARIKEYIHLHILDGLSLARISDEFNFNPSYLSRLFKRREGINISQYIEEAKIEKAKEMLQNPKQKINDLAVRLGLNTPGYFSRVFKDKTGMTPQKYRDIYEKHNGNI